MLNIINYDKTKYNKYKKYNLKKSKNLDKIIISKI